MEKNSIRQISFLLAAAAVTLGAILSEHRLRCEMQKQQHAEQTAVILAMAEEASRTTGLLSTGHTPNLLPAHAAVIRALYALLPPESALTDPLFSAVCFYDRLSEADFSETGTDLPVFLSETADDCAAAFARLAAELLSRDKGSPALPPAAKELARLTTDFLPDPLQHLPDRPENALFANELSVTEQTAKEIAAALFGRRAAILGSPVQSDGVTPLYLFSCRDGYAEISMRGGHLLRFALMPHPAQKETLLPMLPDPELLDAADAFVLACTSENLPVCSRQDRRGIRYFSYGNGSSPAPLLTVGVRLSDGAVLSFDAEAYYRTRTEIPPASGKSGHY